MSVTLPALALAAGNLNAVAGWANILALPVSALGLVFILADRAGARSAAEAVDSRRTWMAPPLDRMVERPELGGQLVAALTAPGPSVVGLTTGLHGAGGFGKSRLATWVCHLPEISRRYPGGLLWVTVGQEIRGADLAARINDLAFALCGRRPAVSDPDAAGAELGRLLNERQPVLLVIDDVWEESQLRPFRFGGQPCTRLVTTRIPDLLPGTGPRIAVDAMSRDQARALVADGVAGLPAEMVDRLAHLAGRWPVLLNLVNGVLRGRVARGQQPTQAAREVMRKLVADGPAVFDPARPGDRSRAVAATVEASLALMDPADRQRCLDLAIFPEDVEIPLDVLVLIWPDCPVDAFGGELVGLGLVADFRLDPPGPRLLLHDVMRAYLQTRRSAAEWAAVHRRLTDAAADLLPAHDGRTPVPWWLLPADAGYLWRYLPHHLHKAERASELAALVCDLRWVEIKTARFGSVVAVESDLQLVDTPTSSALQRALRRSAHLLGPIDPPTALGATLASRLHGLPGLQSVVDRYRATLPRPRLEPTEMPVLDQPDQAAAWAGHIGGVTSCVFSPDGALLATASDDGTARLWNVAEGTVRAVLTNHTGGVWGCAFSPGGVLLATTSDDRTARLWRVDTGLEAAVLHGHSDWVTSCAFSPDGALLATAGQDGTVRLWTVADHTVRAVLTGHIGGVWGCAFSPDGALLATAGQDGTVRLWTVADHATALVLSGHAGEVRDCAFSPDGTVLAATCQDGTARLWKVADGTATAVMTGHTDRAWRCAFSANGALLATTGHDGTARLWDVADGTATAVLAGHVGWVRGCAFSPDGALLATGGNDQTVRLWRVADGTVQTILAGHPGNMRGCAFSPDGTLLALTCEDGSVQLSHLSDASPHVSILRGHTDRANRCAFSPDGTLLAASGDDQTARLWRLPDGTSHAVLVGHTGPVRGCGFSPDGTLVATTSTDRTVRLWRLPDGTPQAVLAGHTGRGNRGCTFSPDGSLLATTGNDQTVRLWRVTDGTTAAVLTGHTDIVTSCAFSPDGAQLASTSDDRTVRLWRVADRTTHAVLTGHTSWVEDCRFSPDGTVLATASRDGTVRLWRAADGTCQCALRVDGPLLGIAWYPDATMLCAVGGAGAHLLAYRP
jgi:WD40 repeat protein